MQTSVATTLLHHFLCPYRACSAMHRLAECPCSIQPLSDIFSWWHAALGFAPSPFNKLMLFCPDCSAVFNWRSTTSGYYRIRPRADREAFLAFCDMADGGGWTVIQRRSNGKEDFNRWMLCSCTNRACSQTTSSCPCPAAGQNPTLEKQDMQDCILVMII